jgi:hypothetical protein
MSESEIEEEVEKEDYKTEYKQRRNVLLEETSLQIWKK